mgnify:FL=1
MNLKRKLAYWIDSSIGQEKYEMEMNHLEFERYIWDRIHRAESQKSGLEKEVERLQERSWCNIKELIRESLEGVTISTDFINEMSHEERLDFCEKANDVFTNPSFKRTLDYLISQQVDFTVKRAESMEQVLFGRATINGLSLVREQFETMAALAEEEKRKDTKMTKEEASEVL